MSEIFKSICLPFREIRETREKNGIKITQNHLNLFKYTVVSNHFNRINSRVI